MPTVRLRLSKEWLILVSLVIVTVGIWFLALKSDQEALQAVFLDVGQGDCAFLRTPSGRTVLVDGGGKGGETDTIGRSVVAPFLRRKAVNRIDVLVLTHPHNDHVGGLVTVLKDFKVGLVLDAAVPHGSDSYRRFLELIERRRIPYRRAVRGQIINFGDGVSGAVLHPPRVHLIGTADDTNENSVMLRFVYGKTSLLLSGDAGSEAETDILKARLSIKSDVLKVGHHGSESSTTPEWLDAVRPRLAIISVGRGNAFGHPSPAVLERLSARGIRILRTDRHGAIMLEISPKTFSANAVLRSSR